MSNSLLARFSVLVVILSNFALCGCSTDPEVRTIGKPAAQVAQENVRPVETTVRESGKVGPSDATLINLSVLAGLYGDTVSNIAEIRLESRPPWASAGQVFVTASEIQFNYDQVSPDSKFASELVQIALIAKTGFFELKPRIQLFIAVRPDDAIAFAKSWNGDPFDALSLPLDSMDDPAEQAERFVEVVERLLALQDRPELPSIQMLTPQELDPLKGNAVFKIFPDECREGWGKSEILYSAETPSFCYNVRYLIWLDRVDVLSTWDAYHRSAGGEVMRSPVGALVQLMGEIDIRGSIFLDALRRELADISRAMAHILGVPPRKISYRITSDRLVSCDPDKSVSNINIEPLNMRNCTNLSLIFVSQDIINTGMARCASRLPLIFALEGALQKRALPFGSSEDIVMSYIKGPPVGHIYHPDRLRSNIEEPMHILVPFEFRHQAPDNAIDERSMRKNELNELITDSVSDFGQCVREFLRFPIAHEMAHLYLKHSECTADRLARDALDALGLPRETGYFSEVMIALVEEGAGSLLPNPAMAEMLKRRAAAYGVNEVDPSCNF